MTEHYSNLYQLNRLVYDNKGGYTFDKDFLRETRIRQLSLKLQATNVALLYADKRLNGDDPDYLANGYTPISPKRLIFTLRVGL